QGPCPVGPSSSPPRTITAPPSPPSARSRAAPAATALEGAALASDEVEEWGDLLGGELGDELLFNDEDMIAAFLEDDLFGEMTVGLDTTTPSTGPSAVFGQPDSVPSFPITEFDAYTIDLLAASGVISGAPGVTMPSMSVGGDGDSADGATGATDAGAALPGTQTTPPAPGPMPALRPTQPIVGKTTSSTETPAFAPSTDSVASTAVAARDSAAAAAAAASAPSKLSAIVSPVPTPPSLTAMEDQAIGPDVSSNTNSIHSPTFSSTAAAPFVVTTETPSVAPSTDSVESTAVAARETAAAAAAARCISAVVRPGSGTPSTSKGPHPATAAGSAQRHDGDGIDDALAMAIHALKIADRAADNSRLTQTTAQARLTTALANFTDKMSMAPPRTSATEMMDSALAACMEQLLFLEERTFVEEETAFSDEVAVRADLGRAMMALSVERKKKKEAEVRAILGDVKKRRSERIRSAALSKVKKERDARPVWDHFSLREMWKAGEIVTL
ncbi:unnamed protein product, partial [Ectocarpus fasciculatus]